MLFDLARESDPINTAGLNYLDLEWDKGELLTLLRRDFGRLAGCDPSIEMLASAEEIDAQRQNDRRDPSA